MNEHLNEGSEELEPMRSDDQAQPAVSVADQAKALRKFAEDSGYEVVGWYLDTGSISWDC